MALRTYRDLLRRPGVARLLGSATLGRLPFGMAGLAILLLVRDGGGSYAAAGLAAGAYGLGLGLAGPVLARTADRRGPTAMIVPVSICGTASLVLVALASRVGIAAVVPAALLAGATTPPLGACLRALWSPLLGGGAAVQTAFALESTVQELIFIGGPLLVAVAIAVDGPTTAVLATAAFLLAGSLLFASAPAARAQTGTSERHGGWLGPLRALALLRVLGSTTLLAVGLGAISVALPAAAEAAGDRNAAGFLLSAWAIGSLLGGLLIAGRAWRSDAAQRMPLFLLAAAAFALPLLRVSGLAGIAVVIMSSGLWIAPSIACAYQLIDRLAPTGTTTEAFAWSGTTFSAGSAIGEAVGGLAIARSGASGGFVLGAAAMLSAALVMLPLRGWNRRLGRQAQHALGNEAVGGELARLVDAPLGGGERDLEGLGDLRVREAHDVP
jgi:hypothetical protein